MKMKRLFLIFAAAFGLTLSSNAQITLTLDQAIELALSENPTIKVAEMEVARYDYVKRETWGNWIPQLSAGGTYTRAIKKQEMAPGLSFGADNTFAGQGEMTWSVFAPAIFRTLKLNDVQMASAVEDARSSRITLVSEVKKSFYNILLAEQSLKVLKESETTVQKTVDDTQIKLDNGLASEYDLLTAQVQLSNIKPTILQAENSITISKLLLKMYLSIPDDVQVAVSGSLDGMRSEVILDTYGLSTDISMNSDLIKLNIQESLLEAQLKVNNASRLPTVQTFFNVQVSGSDLDRSALGGLTGGSTSTTADAGEYWWQYPMSAGVRLSVPIFSGFTISNRSKQIKNQISQIDIQKEYVTNQIEVQIRSAISDLLTAQETMYAQELTVSQAFKAYTIADTRYRSGLGTILELNSAQLSHTQAQLGYSQAIFDYLTAKAEYDMIIGVDM